MQWWGGYPSGRRTVYTVDEDRGVRFPGKLSTANNALIGTTTDGMTANGSIAIAQDLAHRGSYAGFYNTTPIVKPTVSGARNDPEEALASLLTALANLGLLTNSTTAS